MVSESEMLSQGEVESPLLPDQQPIKNVDAFGSLGRQSSIYSLTLDEFQHTLCDSGKNFGSMNMDEFLNCIWTAEEHQNTASNLNNAADTDGGGAQQLALSDASADRVDIATQPSLPRQGSLTLPAPLCRKTVDEVWSEIHKNQRKQQRNKAVQNPGNAPRQPTFGEMTLEDFLIRAGIVREQQAAPPPPPPAYGMYQSTTHPTKGPVSPSFVTRPAMGPVVVAGGYVPAYKTMPASSGGGGESSGYVGNGKRNAGYAAIPPGVCYGGRVVNNGGGGGGGGGGYAGAMVLASPVSPLSSDGMCGGQVESAGNQYGMEVCGLRGRKRMMDGTVEKVVERRQRRMIKNRESAARSRARKQAYTVELEAELNQLREENAHLKQALAELERKRKQQYLEEVRMKAPTKTQKAKDKLRTLRRNSSCPL